MDKGQEAWDAEARQWMRGQALSLLQAPGYSKAVGEVVAQVAALYCHEDEEDEEGGQWAELQRVGEGMAWEALGGHSSSSKALHVLSLLGPWLTPSLTPDHPQGSSSSSREGLAWSLVRLVEQGLSQGDTATRLQALEALGSLVQSIGGGYEEEEAWTRGLHPLQHCLLTALTQLMTNTTPEVVAEALVCMLDMASVNPQVRPPHTPLPQPHSPPPAHVGVSRRK